VPIKIVGKKTAMVVVEVDAVIAVVVIVVILPFESTVI